MSPIRRKPFGVWLLLRDGEAWMFSVEKSLAEALCTARTLRATSSAERVWIAARDLPGHRRRSTREALV